jgi:large subunit ribosomal protein L25
MKQLPLSVKARPAEQQGSANANRLRKSGFVPAEVYGHGEGNLSVALPGKDFTKMLSSLKGENVLFALQVEGSNTSVLALVKEIQFGRMDHTIQHVDFLKVKMDEKIRVRVPIRLLNAALCEGVKEGGSVQHMLRSVEVQCLPNQVPDHLDVDAAPMVIGASIHVSDLKTSEGVKFITDSKTVVLTVAAPVAEEKVAEAVAGVVPAAGAAPAGAAEPEVLTAKKKEEGAAPAAGDAKKPADKAAKK